MNTFFGFWRDANTSTWQQKQQPLIKQANTTQKKQAIVCKPIQASPLTLHLLYRMTCWHTMYTCYPETIIIHTIKTYNIHCIIICTLACFKGGWFMIVCWQEHRWYKAERTSLLLDELTLFHLLLTTIHTYLSPWSSGSEGSTRFRNPRSIVT